MRQKLNKKSSLEEAVKQVTAIVERHLSPLPGVGLSVRAAGSEDSGSALVTFNTLSP
jgi:hypothetical protein